MTGKSFKKIFWGYLALIVLPLLWSPRILGYQISLQFIGYIIILLGIIELESMNQYIAKARNLMYVLIVLSFFSISKVPNSLEMNQDIFATPFILILGIISFIVDLMFTYNLLIGTGELAYDFDFISLSEKAGKYWGYYWKLIIGLFASIFLAFIPGLFIAITLLLAIVAIVLQINILRLFWDCSNKEWEKDENIEFQ